MKELLLTWVPIISSLATLFVAIVALLNVRIARRNLRLLEAKETRWYPDFELYHADSYMLRYPKTNSRIYAVCVRVSNKSDADNSVKELSLLVRFNRGEGVSTNLVIPQASGSVNNIVALANREPEDILSSPLFMKAHAVNTGWALFKVDDALLADTDIESTELRATDTHDKSFVLPLTILRQESRGSQ